MTANPNPAPPADPSPSKPAAELSSTITNHDQGTSDETTSALCQDYLHVTIFLDNLPGLITLC